MTIKHKLQFIDNFSNAHTFKCADPFSVHKAFVKTNLHDILLSEYSNFFARYDILPGQCVCMKRLKRGKDSDSEDNVPKDSVNEICESDIDIEKDEVSVEMAFNIAEKSLELFDCSPLKNVKSEMTFQTGKRKISSVTSAFTKIITIALDEPMLDQYTECLNCSRMVELIKEKLSLREDLRSFIC